MPLPLALRGSLFRESFVSQQSEGILGVDKGLRPLSLRGKLFQNPGGKRLLFLFRELGSLGEGFFKEFDRYSYPLSLPKL